MSYESQIGGAVERLVALSLADTPTLSQVFEVVAQATDTAERVTERVKALAPPPEPIACRAGCGWCCSLRVAVTPPEALRIAAFLRENLSDDELADLQQRLAETEGRTRGLDWPEHVALGIPYPLLVEESCSIHPVRPLSCRGYNSVDVGRCRQYAARPGSVTIPVYTPQQEIAAGLRAGLAAGLEAVGLQGEFGELVAGLRLVLETPDVGERWLSGERVFA